MEKNTARICHDLKSDRVDIAQPLPSYLLFLPILFYSAIAGAVGLSLYFFLELKNAEAARDEWTTKKMSQQGLKAKADQEYKAVASESRRADDVVEWVEGADAIQPLILAVTRSMEAKSTITNLQLTRDRQNPDQLRFVLKFQGGGMLQLDRTKEAINGLGYRMYSAVHTRGQGKNSRAIDYQATLIRQRDSNFAQN